MGAKSLSKKIGVITMAELRQVVGILVHMSEVSLPKTRMFWQKTKGITAVSWVSYL
jgi:hypothetical protein